MVEFETLFMQEKKYGRNSFVEVAKKRSGEGFVFISISKGWYTNDGQKRYKKNFSIAFNKDLMEFMADVLVKLSEDAPTDEEVIKRLEKEKELKEGTEEQSSLAKE